jgi:hypothetical protein
MRSRRCSQTKRERPGTTIEPHLAAEAMIAFHRSPGCILRTRRQQVEAATKALEDLSRCEHLHAGGSQLERERKPVEPLSDLTHRSIGLKARLQTAVRVA